MGGEASKQHTGGIRSITRWGGGAVCCGLLLSAWSSASHAQTYGPSVSVPVPAAPAPNAPSPASNASVAAPAAAAPEAVEPPPVPPAWLLIPAMQVGETFNDNVNLAPKGQERADFISTLTPSLQLIGQTPRVNVNLTYDPQELIFARGTSSNILQQNLLGTGRVEVLRQLLFFDANASISQQYLNNTGPITQNTLTASNNLQTVQAYGGSPYVLEHLGPYANSETRYRFSNVTTSGNLIAPERIQEGLEKITSGEYFGRLSWVFTGDYSKTERLTGTLDPFSGTTSTDAVARLDATYPVYQALSAVAGVGYERLSDPTLLAQQFKGLVWDVGAQYQPNERLLTKLTYGRRLNQTDIEFRTTYFPSANLHAQAAYSLTVLTGQSAIAAALGGICPGPNGTLVNCVTQLPIAPAAAPGNNPPGLAVSPLGLASGSVISKTFSMDVGATRERNTYDITAYETEETGTTGTVASERLTGATASWAHQISPNLSLSTSALYYHAQFLDGSGRVDNSYTVSLGLAYTMSRTTTANLSISRSDLLSNEAANSLINDLITASIRKQF